MAACKGVGENNGYQKPHGAEFVQHDREEGVDRIRIFDNNSDLANDETVQRRKRVIIVDDKALDNMGPSEITTEIFRMFIPQTEWLINVDMDEFITTRRRPDSTIRRELENTFVAADCVKVPWIMMCANGRKTNPDCLLTETTYRWDHDRRHPNRTTRHQKFRCRFDAIEVKCIFRPEKFSGLADHNPRGALDRIVCVDSVDNRPSPLGPYYSNLREAKISNAHLVCYHYRTYSVESAQQKLCSSAYYVGYTLDDIMSADYPELLDDTLACKTCARRS